MLEKYAQGTEIICTPYIPYTTEKLAESNDIKMPMKLVK
jgi:hypothetical protein